MLTTPRVKRILIIAALILAAIILYIYFYDFLPILIAILTALIFEPFVQWMKNKMNVSKRILPVTTVFILFLMTCAVLIYLTFTRVVDSIYQFSLNIPSYALEIEYYISDLIIRFNELVNEIPYSNVLIREIEETSNRFVTMALNFTSYLLTTLVSWIQSVPNLIFVSLFYLITLFLFSLDLPRLKRVFYNFFKPETRKRLQFVNQRMGKVFLGYWKAQFILSVGVFIITYFSLRFISPGAALIMATIIWLVDIIPLYVGPALILIPWGIMAMIIGNMGIGVQLILLAVVITVLRRIVEPKVLGDSMGMGALPTVLSMYFGFVFGGVMGMILGPFVYMGILSAKESDLFELAKEKTDKAIEESSKT